MSNQQITFYSVVHQSQHHFGLSAMRQDVHVHHCHDID